MPKKELFFIGCMLICFSLCSQKVINEFDFTYPGNGKDNIEDITLLSDDFLVAVGSTQIDKSTSKGLLLVINPNDGALIDRKEFSKTSKCGFKSIAESGDGSLYLVGFAQGRKKERNAWLLRLDADLSTVHETVLDIPGDNFFEKIIWLEAGFGLIVGWKDAFKKGEIWVKSIDGNQFQGIDKELGSGAFGEIIGLEPGLGDRIWITGNTQKSKTVQRGNAWVIQMNTNGQILQERIIGNKFFDQIHCASSTILGELLLGGETWSRSSDYGNSWLVELDAKGQEVYQDVFKTKTTQFTAGIVKKPRHDRWISVQEKGAIVSPESLKLILAANNFDAQYPVKIDREAQFEVKKLLLSYHDQYLIAGNVSTDKKGKAFRLISFSEAAILNTKFTPELTASSPRLEDESGDGILTPGELGTVTFFVENKSSFDIPKMTIKATLNHDASGFIITKPNRFLPFLPKGMKKRIDIPVKGVPHEQTQSQGIFQIVISVNQQEVLSFPASIEPSKTPQKSVLQNTPEGRSNSGIKMTWQRPNLISTGSREVSTTNNNYTIKLNISSKRTIKAEDPKIYRNNRLLVDGKNSLPLLSEPIEEGDWLDYSFSFDVQGLEEGENVIAIKIGDFETSVSIFYEPRKPDLHVLAIGPNYQDLKYPSKDALDFANQLEQQKGRGFFREVYIDTLLQPHNTDKISIVSAFELLSNRYHQKDHPKAIKPNDYLMVFISGHGIRYNGSFRLIPTDYNPNAKSTTTIHYKEELLRFLNEIQCKKIMFIDACLSGAAKGAKSNSINPYQLNQALKLANESVPGMVSFSSSSEDQLSYEDEAWENGAFTEALLEAFKAESPLLSNGTTIFPDLTEADQPADGVLTIGELFEFLKKRVPDLVSTAKDQATQVPTLTTQTLDEKIPLIILK